MDIRTLAASAGWSNRALIDHYRCSLCKDVHRELACRDTTLTFDQLVDLSIRLDNLLATRRRLERGLSLPSPSTTSPMPMELGGAVRRETGGGSVSCTICGPDVTLPVGGGLVHLGIEAAGGELWCHPR